MSSNPHVLIVEDDPEYVNHIVGVIQEINATSIIEVAGSREEAIQALTSDKFFDLLHLDLTLPYSKGNPDKKVEYGAEVFHVSREQALGLPILILTGSSTDALVSDFLRSADQSDVWGTGEKRPTVDHVQKMDLDRYDDEIRQILEAIKSLNDIELTRSPTSLDLPIEHDRLIRIFCRRKGAVRCQVSRVSGGLSSSKVYQINAYNSSGNSIYNVIAKVAPHSIIQDEHDNFNSSVERLRQDVTPRHIATFVFGAKNTAAVFYGFADGYQADFFSISRTNKVGTALAEKIKSMTDKWCEASSEKTVTIQDIRRLLLDDTETERISQNYELDWLSAFEGKSIQANWCLIHGDLHGKNVLINESDQTSALIDYGDIREGSAVIDPVTMEFSLFFHPETVVSGDWPTSEQAKNWYDLETYLENCPIPEVINFLRSWTEDAAVGNREIAAAAYAYLIRQLKYDDTNAELALNFLEGARKLYDDRG